MGWSNVGFSIAGGSQSHPLGIWQVLYRVSICSSLPLSRSGAAEIDSQRLSCMTFIRSKKEKDSYRLYVHKLYIRSGLGFQLDYNGYLKFLIWKSVRSANSSFSIALECSDQLECKCEVGSDGYIPGIGAGPCFSFL